MPLRLPAALEHPQPQVASELPALSVSLRPLLLAASVSRRQHPAASGLPQRLRRLAASEEASVSLRQQRHLAASGSLPLLLRARSDNPPPQPEDSDNPRQPQGRSGNPQRQRVRSDSRRRRRAERSGSRQQRLRVRSGNRRRRRAERSGNPQHRLRVRSGSQRRQAARSGRRRRSERSLRRRVGLVRPPRSVSLRRVGSAPLLVPAGRSGSLPRQRVPSGSRRRLPVGRLDSLRRRREDSGNRLRAALGSPQPQLGRSGSLRQAPVRLERSRRSDSRRPLRGASEPPRLPADLDNRRRQQAGLEPHPRQAGSGNRRLLPVGSAQHPQRVGSVRRLRPEGSAPSLQQAALGMWSERQQSPRRTHTRTHSLTHSAAPGGFGAAPAAGGFGAAPAAGGFGAAPAAGGFGAAPAAGGFGAAPAAGGFGAAPAAGGFGAAPAAGGFGAAPAAGGFGAAPAAGGFGAAPAAGGFGYVTSVTVLAKATKTHTRIPTVDLARNLPPHPLRLQQAASGGLVLWRRLRPLQLRPPRRRSCRCS